QNYNLHRWYPSLPGQQEARLYHARPESLGELLTAAGQSQPAFYGRRRGAKVDTRATCWHKKPRCFEALHESRKVATRNSPPVRAIPRRLALLPKRCRGY